MASPIATISAGYMDGNRPVVSRDGTIYRHNEGGHAPHLKSELEGRNYKRLTIAFIYDDLNKIIKQRWVAYSRGKCQWSGDQRSMTVFREPVKVYPAGTEGYARVMAHKDTKLHYSIFFGLAEWMKNGARITLRDHRDRDYDADLLAAHLKVARIVRGHTIHQAAEAMGLSPGTVSNLGHCRHVPKAES